MKTLIAVSNSNLRKIIFNRTFLDKLSAISEIHWVQEDKPYTVDDLSRDIGNYEACITSWGSPRFTPEVLSQAKKLKFIGHAAGSVAWLVDPSIYSSDIVVVNANAGLAFSTAESALAMILSCGWDLFGYSERLKAGEWTDNFSLTINGLYNRVIGIVGYGEISIELIRLLEPLHPQILLHSDHVTQEEADELRAKLVGLDELLRESEIISIHKTLTPSTRGMIGKKELSLIQDGALLVNTARADIFKEDELLEALREGRFQAVLDVFHTEPLNRDSEFLKLSNVICLPHIGGQSKYWKTRLGEMVVQDLERWLHNESPRGWITEEKYYRQTASIKKLS